jgi:hypothetical protein
MPVQTMARTAVRRKSATAMRTAASRSSVAKNAASNQQAKASTTSIAGWEVRGTATPAGLVASSQGNAQTTGTGDLFAGWGNLPYFSEFSPSGRLLFNAELPTGVNSYRAYRLPWPGR